MRTNNGFTLLEMVVVLVIMGVVSSLAVPGLQKMYDSMSASLMRNELSASLNNLALDVRAQGRSLVFRGYPASSDVLPGRFLKRLEVLDVTLEMQEPLLITAAGFCPHAGVMKVIKGEKSYLLNLRSPDCRVVPE
jgi:prepilin-type N-terminal cleavage/methylation domain-containing protein